MYITKVGLRNWRNFKNVDVSFSSATTYMMGPNASGKSNFLDVFRFIRDVVDPKGGGLQKAVESRGGMKKLRSVYARQKPTIDIEIELNDSLAFNGDSHQWVYQLSIQTEKGGKNRPVVKSERVIKQGVTIVDRPQPDDESDPERLTQTFIEQINMNKDFREVSDFFARVTYLHLVPQLLKFGDGMGTQRLSNDPFGQGFLEQISETNQKTRDSRLKKIEQILKNVIPHFESLRFVKDDVTGAPHIEMRYVHWRPNAGWQREDQFSDGTLRLIGIIWVLLTSNNLILLEEPELSLHARVVEQIPQLIHKTHKSRKTAGGQIFISTHSESLLQNKSIGGDFLLLVPHKDKEGTDIRNPSDNDNAALESGMSAAEILLPQTSESIGSV